MESEPFHLKWTRVFLTKSYPHAEAVALHNNLISECSQHTWHRCVIDKWHDEYLDDNRVIQLADWLAHSGDPQVFVTPRASTQIHTVGAQVWHTSDLVQVLLNMMCHVVVPKRTFTHLEFQDEMWYKLVKRSHSP